MEVLHGLLRGMPCAELHMHDEATSTSSTSVLVSDSLVAGGERMFKHRAHDVLLPGWAQRKHLSIHGHLQSGAAVRCAPALQLGVSQRAAGCLTGTLDAVACQCERVGSVQPALGRSA